VFDSGEIDDNSRLMALLCLHTAVKRHWRPARQSRNAPPIHTMAEDEKARLRAFLLSHMQEPQPLVRPSHSAAYPIFGASPSTKA
jgi:hypothetical protein